MGQQPLHCPINRTAVTLSSQCPINGTSVTLSSQCPINGTAVTLSKHCPINGTAVIFSQTQVCNDCKDNNTSKSNNTFDLIILQATTTFFIYYKFYVKVTRLYRNCILFKCYLKTLIMQNWMSCDKIVTERVFFKTRSRSLQMYRLGYRQELLGDTMDNVHVYMHTYTLIHCSHAHTI